MAKIFNASRISSMTTSIFATMSKMAFEYNATNLGQGFPDFDGPSWIMEAAFDAMKSGKNQYAPSPGIMSLRKAIKDYHKKYYDLDWSEDEIIITAGATEALYSTINAFIEQGDEVVIFEPFYDSYLADIVLAGGSPVCVTLHKPDFSFSKEELEAAITKKTKMIILNTPHNPTGKLFSKEELEFIASLAIKNDLLVVSDEVYEFLTFDGAKHIPIASIEGMKKRTITISSTGKTFGLTGWKIGYAIANEMLATAIQKVHQWTTFAVNTPGQHAMAYAFSQLDSYLPEFRKTYKEKRDLINAELKNTGFKPHLPLGSYFIMADLPDGVFNDDVDAATRLVKDYGVATIPPSVFYLRSDEGKTMLRLCFAKQNETIIEGIRKMAMV